MSSRTKPTDELSIADLQRQRVPVLPAPDELASPLVVDHVMQSIPRGARQHAETVAVEVQQIWIGSAEAVAKVCQLVTLVLFLGPVTRQVGHPYIRLCVGSSESFWAR